MSGSRFLQHEAGELAVGGEFDVARTIVILNPIECRTTYTALSRQSRHIWLLLHSHFKKFIQCYHRIFWVCHEASNSCCTGESPVLTISYLRQYVNQRMESNMTKQYQSDTINELATALAKAQAEMTHAAKGVDNTFFKSKYADLPAIIDVARPHLAKNGLSVVQLPDVDEAGNITLMTQLMHASGQWMRSWYPVKPVKNDPQGFGSALTYARRYSYASITGVSAVGEDDDGNAASEKSNKPPEYKGVFDSEDLLSTFVANCVTAIKAAENGPAVKDQKELNLAKWNAMKDSSNPLDRGGYEAIVATYNEAFNKFKAMKEAKPSTVDAAKQAALLPASVANDQIDF